MDNLGNNILNKLRLIQTNFEKLQIKAEPKPNQIEQRSTDSLFSKNLQILELLAKTPEEIVSEFVCNPTFSFDDFLNNNDSEIELSLFNNLIKLIEKSFHSHSLTVSLIDVFLSSELFNEHIFDYLIQNNLGKELLKSLISIYSSIINRKPNYRSRIEPFKHELEITIKKRLKCKDLSDYFDFKVNNITREVHPPNDFTELSIVPRLDDIINDDQPFIRKNIINGSYNNVRHYLDVQFRLLREDFFQPLRLGVNEFRSIIQESNPNNLKRSNILTNETCKKLERIDSLYVYFDVRMDSSLPSDDGILYNMVLNFNKNSREIRWDTSKRLIHGSLVCLSSDYFQNECITGIVCERNIGYEKSVLVKFDPDSKRGCSLPVSYKNYVMLETTAFFESYKHVLQALISFQLEEENDFPFKEQIVYGNTQSIDIPAYLKNALIDFGPLVDNKIARNISYKCSISNEHTWPNSEQMKLEESQYDAIKLALKNKLAIIQGPPGTGKTYIGVKLVQLLIHNKQLWYDKPKEQKRPILMICYTNHALDQFLENCIDKCGLETGVVRVGGRCKSENLEPFLLKNIKKNNRYRRSKSSIKKNLKAERNQLNELKRQIFKYQDKLKFCNDAGLLLNVKCLEKFMKSEHLDQLESFNYTAWKKNAEMDDMDNILLEWLGFSQFADYEDDFLKYLIEDEADIELLKFLNSFNFTRADFGLEEIESSDELYSDMLNIPLLQTSPSKKSNKNDVVPDKVKEEFYDLEYTNKLNSDRMLDDEINKYAQFFKNNNNNKKDTNYSYYSNYYDFAISEEEIFDLSVRNKIPKNVFNLSLSQKYKSVETYLKNILNFESSNQHSSCNNIWSLSLPERFALYMSWVNDYRDSIHQKIKHLHKNYNMSAETFKSLKLQEDKSIMENSFIIAMTTTGSARYHSILKEIGPRIVIVEEAAEVFEQHIISSLSKHCQHLILIGDHIQLRPNPAVYKLATDYHLDVSLFERLLNNNTKKVMLNCQHRMRPEISILMKNFYEKPIDDHESVLTYPSVRGFNKNFYFLDHENLERVANDSQSKSNLFEAGFIVNLCLYLLLQNYEQKQITILTMYLGQMSELNKLLRLHNLTEVKCTTVDNYQGEENDIILLSLVRSNERNVIGFLKIYNRCCVALSRAKMGFYCLGNFSLLTHNSNKWLNIYTMLYETFAVGRTMTLTCEKHPENDVEVQTVAQVADRLQFSGGCHLECNFKLRCGHICELFCHSYDLDHIEYKCPKKCKKQMLKCRHACDQICSHEGECNKCEVKVQKIVPECGHKIIINCDTQPTKADCIVMVEKVVNECGHKINFKCGQIPTRNNCQEKIEPTSTCGHESKLPILCYDKIYTYQTKCQEKCNEILSCSHKCSALCKDCYGGYIHENCKEKCKLTLACGHKCKNLCSEQCEPCEQKCKKRCFHSKCKLKCSDPCRPCLKPCKWQCVHKKCTKKCFEKCDRTVCNEPCPLKLQCNHPCIGLCGETCPRLCKICDKGKLETFFKNDKLTVENSRFVHLIDCNHLVEMNQMDILMLKYNNSDARLPECPTCNTPIRLNMRYSNITKAYDQKIELLKRKDSNNQSLIDLKNEFIKCLESEKQYLNRRFSFSLAKEIKAKFRTLSQIELVSFINRWKLYLYLREMRIAYDGYFLKIADEVLNIDQQQSLLIYELNKLESIVTKKTSRFYDLLFDGQQRFNEILNEVKRTSSIFEFIQIKNANQKESKQNGEINSALRSLEECLIAQITPFDKQVMTKLYFIKLGILLPNEPKVSFKQFKPFILP